MAEKGFLRRQFPNPIYPRMLGYIITICMHIYNFVLLLKTFKGDILEDPEIVFFTKNQLRLLTIWICLAQPFYAVLGMSCDILSLVKEDKSSILLNTLNSIRDRFFTLFVFPVSVVVTTFFWSIYNYEPTIMLPESLLKVFPCECNHMMHTFILPVVLWEVTFRPRKAPESRLFNFVVVNLIGITYIAVLFLTYFESSKFPYPIFTNLYGTQYFYVLLGACFLILNFGYNIQWPLTEYAWGSQNGVVKKIK